MSLLKRDPNAPQAWIGDLPVTSRYTAGIAGERFFRAIKDEGVIYGSYCDRCATNYVPARLFCERCLDELDEWTDVGTTGEVHTFTLLFENLEGTPRQEPEVITWTCWRLAYRWKPCSERRKNGRALSWISPTSDRSSNWNINILLDRE